MNLKSTSPNSLTEAVRRKWRTPEQCITGEGEALFQQSSLLREETRVLGIPKLFYGKLCFMKLEKLLSVSFPQILGVRHPRVQKKKSEKNKEPPPEEPTYQLLLFKCTPLFSCCTTWPLILIHYASSSTVFFDRDPL